MSTTKQEREQKALSRIQQMTAEKRSNLLMNSQVRDAVSTILGSVEDNNIKLKVNKVWVKEKFDDDDIHTQQKVRNKGQSWTNDLRGDLSLIDKESGKVIDRVEDIKLTNIPKITPRSTYLIKGNEYQYTKQSRLKPGVYTREQSNGEISSFFNVDKTIDFDRGFNNNFKINFNPESKVFTMRYGTKNVPLINALSAIGVDKSDVIKKWGKDVYEANRKAYDKHEVRDLGKLYEAIFGYRPQKDAHIEQVKKEIRDRLFATELSGETTSITLGKPYDNVGKEVLLDASKKIIDVHKGDVEGDDRESLVFKSYYDVDDHIKERLVRNKDKIVSGIRFKLAKNRNINKSISSQAFDPTVIGTITQNILSNPPNQTNVMSIIGESTKTTVMGDGGVGTSNAVTNDIRNISNSEAGFIDPLHTPEGGNIGIAVHSTLGTVKVGNDIYNKFLSPSGERAVLSPTQTYDKRVAFPDEYDLSGDKPKAKNKRIKVIYKGKLEEVIPSKVDYIISNASNLFDSSANMIPFLDSIQGNRGLTASKMQEQALSLKDREKPLFNVVNEQGKSISEALASLIALPKAKTDGTVEKVTKNDIIVRGRDGNEYTHQLYNNYSLNTEGFLHNTPIVRVGDTVKKGQVLADNNNTRDGQIAIGANLNVAYMPYKGYNYEDSAIVSESAAKKLTSEHMYDLKAKRSSKGTFSKSKFRAYYPEVITAKQAEKLDNDGIIRVGQEVETGDTVITHLERKTPTADDLAIGRLSKQTMRDMSDKSVKWDHDHKGIVTGVQKHGNSVVVNIKTEEPLQIADKVSGLHGNKHIISRIIPDDEMPLNPVTGERIHMTMNPLGVSGRINTSQLLENAAGKIAKKTGKQYVIQNFKNVDNTRKILDDLKAAGLSDKDELINPETGKPFLNPIANGVSHILKLEHKVDHKFSSRYRDGHDSNEQAITGGRAGGKNVGRMETAALLARGANENLDEMFRIKGQKNDEYWQALEMGRMLPPPESPFVLNKFYSMLKGSGINVDQKGKTYALKPMTDRDIIDLSKGELKRPHETYRKKDFAPMKEGLFDPVKVGGMRGDSFTHFKLPEKVLNPITAMGAASLLEMPVKRLEDIIEGKKFVDRRTGNLVEKGTPNSISGSPAIELLLKQVDVDKELKASEKISGESMNPTQLNKVHRKIRTLKSLKQNKMTPSDYFINNVLVVPSKYRPMFSLGNDGNVLLSDINELYQQTAHSASAMKDLKSELKGIGSEDIENMQLAEARGALYNDMKAVAGLREPTAYLHRIKDKKGFISQIDGGKKKQTKTGFFQDKVLERRQDLVGRSTIILNPELGGDEIGIPKDMATDIFRPFIMKKIVSWGYTPLEASKQIKDKTPVFERAREVVSGERLVIANRAPTLHKWNMTAFKPKLVDHKSIEVPGLVINKNFGGDFDGDSALQSIYILANADQIRQFSENEEKVVFSECCIDSNDENDCISPVDYFFNQRRANMPSITKLLFVQNREVFHVHLEDFPRIESSKIVRENGNVEYKVPPGISIFTVDNDTHEFIEVPVTEFSIHKNLKNYMVTLSDKSTMMVSSDESMVAVDTNDWKVKTCAPNIINSSTLMVPKVLNIETSESITSIDLVHNSYLKAKDPIKCVDTILLNRSFGHYIGMMIGDGCADTRGRISFATTYDNLRDEFVSMTKAFTMEEVKSYTYPNEHNFGGFDSYSEKHCITSHELAFNIEQWIGSGAHNKHLPPFYLNTPREFRLGLFEGLIDTDGSSAWTTSGGRDRYQMLYTTVSPRLNDEIVTLAKSLGITASYSYERNRRAYQISISTTTLHNKGIELRHEKKGMCLNKFFSSYDGSVSSIEARLDLVPFSESLFLDCKKFIHHTKNQPEYRAINDTKRRGCPYISRYSANRIIELDKDNILDARWKKIVANKSVTWIYIKNLNLNDERVDMYDITAPGPYTFMLSNGIIVQDTFQIHTPIGTKALEEARQMLPSGNMLKTGYDTVLNHPDMDMVVGGYLVSRGQGGKKTNLSFSNLNQARKSFENHEFTYADKVKVGNIEAPFGMHEINSVLPENQRKYDIELTGKNTDEWIKNVSLQVNNRTGLELADKIKEVGNNYSTTFGFTLGPSDTVSAREIRNPIIEKAIKETDMSSVKDVVNRFSKATSDINKAIEKKHGSKTMIGIGIQSGGGKGIGNTGAIMSMPGILSDANDVPIPIPVTKSYSEGLNSFGYWAAAHGARAGNIKKSVSSWKPGAMTKDLMNSIYNTRIYEEAPADTEGIEYPITDKKAVMNRYLASDVKSSNGRIVAKRNELVDDNVINKLSKEKIKNIFVQSPLTDPTPGDGISSYSYGVDYDKKNLNRGDNVGVISAHTITEPSLNMAMKAFHTGGAFTGSSTKDRSRGTVFDALDRTLRFTRTIPDRATVASMDGKVKKISKSSIGGYDVILSDGDKEEVRYIEPGRDLKIKENENVKKGDVLSSGTPSMHDILKYKGMRDTQKFLVDQISEFNDHKLDKRNIEVLVRGITNTTRVMEPGSSDYVVGDVIPYTTAEYFNKNNISEVDVEKSRGTRLNKDYAGFKKNHIVDGRDIKTLQGKGIKRIEVKKDPIKHEPFLMPTGIGAKAAASEDWIARMAHNRIRNVLQEGTLQGWKTEITPTGHPISKLVVS